MLLSCLGFDRREELMVALVSCVLSPQVPLKSGPDVTPRGGPSGPAVLGCGWPRHAAALWSGWHHQQSGVAALEVGPRCLSVEMCLCTCCVHVELMKHLFAHRWLTRLFMTSFCCWIMSLFSHEFTQTHDAVIYSPTCDESSHTLKKFPRPRSTGELHVATVGFRKKNTED